MKGKKFDILIIFIALMSLGLLIGLNMYNKPLIDIKEASVEIEISTQNIIDEYQKDELTANKKYVGNIIEITGEISKITIDNGNSVIIFKGKKGESSVMCHMSPEENLKALKLKEGAKVTVKGVCTGYLLDVIMVRCILINN